LQSKADGSGEPSYLVSLQSKADGSGEPSYSARPETPPAKAKGPVFELPKSINTQIELEDVQLSRILDKSKTFGIPIILPIAGKLSLKADATIPLRKLSSLRQYGFHGQATLKEASILGVDLGRLDATLDLKDGVLELTDFRGRFVERPAGTYQEPPPASPAVAAEGELPPGAFRGTLRAELSPKGKITARINGRELPLTELAAPFTPRPTPVSGRVDLDMRAEGAVDSLQDPNAWTAQGQIHAQDVTARGATLTALKTSFSLADGDFKLPDLTANLNGKPLALAGSIQLAAPQAFRVKLDVAEWSLADLEAFVPSIPRPPPFAGALTANIEASGTLAPLVAAIDGDGSIAAFQLGPVPLGTLPFRFRTVDETIHITIDDARPFGGRITAKASIPTHSGPRASGSLTLRGIDLARLSAAVPDDPWRLTGKGSGVLEFSAATRNAPDVSPFDANLTLDAADLTVRGIEARNLRAVVTARRGTLHYDVFTESLGGTLKFQGDYPLKAASAGAEASANLQAVGFSINDLARALGARGMAAELSGTGALDANILASLPALEPRAAGRLEVRDLQLGTDFPVGNLNGVLHYGPEAWRLEPLNGRLLGGVATGRVWSDRGDDGANDVRFGMDLANASLADALAFLPFVAKRIVGRGAFRLSGRLGTTLRVELQAQVNRASVFNLPLVELRAPGELTYNAAAKTGTLVVRDATARYGGGQLRMSSRFQFGADPRYRVRLHVTKLDLEGLARASSDARRTASGRITGDIELNGLNPADLKRMNGRVNLDLSDASIVELPIFRELGQFLGAARGGLFERGNLSGQIAERRLLVEQLALQGRLVQIHATGSIGFDRQLDLDVLINTNQIIPETGAALARLIPGLNGSTRREQALRQVSGFLSTRLTKVHVAGTLDSPQVNIDPAILVTEGAASFFVGVLELPLNLVR
jgi:translocation and assembly module TamB